MNERLRDATYTDVPITRGLQMQGMGLREIANYLNVYSASLDLMLWKYIDLPDEELGSRKYEPMFD